jgi:hypothetical protein
MMEEIEHKYQILADIIHEEVLATLPDFWEGTPITDLMKTFVDVSELREFLEDKINNASEEEIKLTTKYNIKDVLIKNDELAHMNVFLLSIEELEARLEVEHKISLATH